MSKDKQLRLKMCCKFSLGDKKKDPHRFWTNNRHENSDNMWNGLASLNRLSSNGKQMKFIIYRFIYWVRQILATLSSSKSLVVGRSVGLSVTRRLWKKWPSEYGMVTKTNLPHTCMTVATLVTNTSGSSDRSANSESSESSDSSDNSDKKKTFFIKMLFFKELLNQKKCHQKKIS